MGLFRELITNAVTQWNRNSGSRISAALAFYAILSLAPLLVFGMAVGSHFLSSSSLRGSIMDQASEQLGPGAATLVGSMLENDAKPKAGIIAGSISVVAALFGAAALFSQLSLALNTIWEIEEKPIGFIRGFITSKVFSIFLTLIFLTLIACWIAIDAVVNYTSHHSGILPGFGPLLSFIFSAIFLTVAFAVVFKFLPKDSASWKDVWLPAILTALVFSSAKFAFSLYFRFAGPGTAYGPAGTLIIVLLWIYYSMQIFLFGAELTYAYAHSFGSLKPLN